MKAWQSLASGEGAEGVTYREIDANDIRVEHIADAVKSNKDYSYVPSATSNSVNSNSAAGAVANAADGGSTAVEHGGWQPGHKQADRVEFSKQVREKK